MKIDIKDHAEFSKYLKKGLEEALEKSLLSTATRLVAHINTSVIPNTKPFQPVDRGTFRAGWRIRRASKRTIHIFNSTPHAGFIEWGVRGANVKPGRAMITALTAWVKRKGIGARSSIKTRKVTKASTETATGIAWAIAKKMQKKGIFGGGNAPPGMRILQRALLRFDSFFREEIEREMGKKL